MASSKRLRRSDDSVIAGVCGGIAEYADIPAGRVRVAYLVLSILSVGFPGILVYLVLWILLPKSETKFRLEDFRKQ